MKIAFWFSLFSIFYIYQGYLWALKLLRLFNVAGDKRIHPDEGWELPTITVLLTVCNEEKKVERRIRNILDCEFPKNKLEILIASDGSTDSTEEIVAKLAQNYPVRLFSSGGRLGKTETQNRAIPKAAGEIIVFTDADTSFSKEFLREIAQPFRDSHIGMATAHLLFSQVEGSVSKSQGYYWSYELKLRQMESELGILAVGSGQCMAVRKSLIRPMEPFVGEDCLIPLDVVLQGSLVVHQSSALAYDHLEAEPEREFRTRVRMTLRNWLGTWRRSSLLNPFAYPGYSFSLLSHKIFRWLSPFFLIMIAGSLMYLSHEGLYGWLLIGMLTLVVFSVIGWAGSAMGRNIPVASQGFGFLLANAGFLIGVLKAMFGSKIVTYRSGELEKQVRAENPP